MTAAITGDSSITYSKDSSQVIHKADGRYSVIVSPLYQEIDDWQSSVELSIGGVSSTDTAHWIGKPKAKGSCEVSYDPQTDSVTLNWNGTGSGSAGGSSGGTGTGGNGTGGAGTGGNNTGGIGTGGSTGGTGTGGSSTGGTDTGVSGDGSSSDGFESGDNDGETTLTPAEIEFKKLSEDAENMPTSDGMYKRGQLYRYNGKIYICKVPGKYNIPNESNPEGNVIQQFPPFQEDMIENAWDDSNLNFEFHKFTDIKYGQIYRDTKGNYFMFVSGSKEQGTWSDIPDESAYNDGNNWLPILPDKHNRD